ncbi:transcription factor ETV7 isoform X3 [Parambassis ranga]|uniref:Transcription factor ETV7 isoform X3 n=1 Tax=Parambassis ranga TaxID=210632 RepID=A0A6P7IV06_9TELE|nr:transcription factor ETV6-like isoform X3 [Parambassis ranga]
MESASPSPLIKQEKNEISPSPIMLSGQVSIPPTMHLPPLPQPPVLSPPTQEDLWHLPGRLRINPSLWDKEDVAHWLHWAQKEYSLRRPEKGHFEMNGRALCLLTKEDFRRRCPSSVSSVFTTAVSAAVVATVSSRPEPVSPRRDRHVLSTYSAPFAHNNGAVSTLADNQVQCHPQTETIQEPLNLSSRQKPRSPLHKANGRIPECRLLWDYVYQLLCDDSYQEYIRWEDPDSLVFRVVDPNGLARLWGNHKNRHNMTYEKMSRALRHYYKLNIIKKERGQKLLFRFLKLPQDIKKHQVDTVRSPENTPPQDSDFPDSSPIHEFSQDHFEVSPDRSSPPNPPSTGTPVR